MLKKTLLWFIIFYCLLHMPVQAQSYGGGEIYYELISPRKYKITAHIYRMCETTTVNGITGYVIGSNATQVGFGFVRTSIKKINDTCGNPCKVQNAPSTAGFERHTFEATVDLNTTPYASIVSNSCNVHFASKMSGRVTGTTHGSGLLYLDAMVNICDTTVKSNRSPVFSMEPKFYAFCSQPLWYSPGTMDTTDYDSLAFELAPIMFDFNKTIAYNTNYSASIPLTPYCPPNPNVTNCRALPNAIPPRGFYFDNLTGQIVLTPTKCNEKGYVKIRVSEYRRNPVTGQMVLLGYINREMLVQVKQVINNNPVSILGGQAVMNICATDAVLSLRTSDQQNTPNQSQPDTTFIFWDNGYKPSVFQVVDTSRERGANITLKKDSSLKYIKTQFFTVGAYDKVCNISLTSRTFLAKDNPLTQYKISKSISSCNVLKYQVTNPDTNNAANVKSSVTITDAFSQMVFSSAKNNDSFTFNSNGKHIIRYNISNFPFACTETVYDTITISNAFLKGKINSGNDSTVCAPYQAQLRFNPYKSPGLVKIQWLMNDSVINTKDSSIQLTLSNNSPFRLRLTDTRGCLAESAFTYWIKTHSPLQDLPITQCKNTLVSYTAIINTLKLPVAYKWDLNGKDPGVSGRTLDFIIRDTSMIRLTVTDSNNCVFNDSVRAYIKTSFNFDIMKDKPEICSDSSLTLTASGITAIQPYKLVWKVSPTDSLEDDTVLKRSYAGRKDIILSITDANSCPLLDTVTIIPEVTPKFSLPKFVPVCEGVEVNVNPAFSTNAFPKTFEWAVDGNPSQVTDSVFSFVISKPLGLKVRIFNKLGCFTEDSTNVPMNPKPDFNILSKTNYHHSNRIVLSTDKPFKAYQWFNNVYVRNDTFWAYTLGTPGKYKVWCLVTDGNGCNGTDTIEIFTDKFVGLSPAFASGIRIFPNPGHKTLYIASPEDHALVIMDAQGKMLYDRLLTKGLNTIDTEAFAPGLYIIHINGQQVKWLKE